MNQLANTASPVILIADDDRDILSIIETILKEDGYQTLTAMDGSEAVSVVQRQSVQLLILDIMMPKMNGLQAATKIRELTNAPILMLSAKGENSDRVIGLNMGADDYLVKPFFPRGTARPRSFSFETLFVAWLCRRQFWQSFAIS